MHIRPLQLDILFLGPSPSHFTVGRSAKKSKYVNFLSITSCILAGRPKSYDQSTALSVSKDGCVTFQRRLYFSGMSAAQTGYKSYKKWRFATITRCLKIAAVLTHAHDNHVFTFFNTGAKRCGRLGPRNRTLS